MSSSQLTSIFFRGVGIPPTRISSYIYTCWCKLNKLGTLGFCNAPTPLPRCSQQPSTRRMKQYYAQFPEKRSPEELSPGAFSQHYPGVIKRPDLAKLDITFYHWFFWSGFEFCLEFVFVYVTSVGGSGRATIREARDDDNNPQQSFMHHCLLSN